MIKICAPSGWVFDEPIAALIKISSRGLIGNDRAAFIKRAGHAFADALDRVKLAADETPVHLLAVGAFEGYSANRNGDAFRERGLQRHHDTFRKYAKVYRNHAHMDPRKSYGVVKLSIYNPEMRRVELLAGLNNDKQAAERNAGLVADRELEKLARNEDIPFSMACKVAFDVCDICGNKAKHRAEYCKAATCPGGGCTDNLGKLVKVAGDFRHVCVHNDDPMFFDISHVFKPADRIAYGGLADWIKSAALNDEIVGGAAAAEQFGAGGPLPIALGLAPVVIDEIVKIAQCLAALEATAPRRFTAEVGRAFAADIQGLTDVDAFGAPGTTKLAATLAALADLKIILPPRDFARLAGRPELADAVAGAAHGIYTKLASDAGGLERMAAANRFALAPADVSAPARQLALRLKTALSLELEDVDHRCRLSALRGYAPATLTKRAGAVNGEALALACEYGVYKAAALQHVLTRRDSDFLLTAHLALLQNRVQ